MGICGGGGNQTGSSTSTSYIDPKLTAQIYGLINQGLDVGSGNYPLYQDQYGKAIPRIAGFTDQQTQAQQQAGQAGQIGSDATSQAAKTLGGLQGFNPQQVGSNQAQLGQLGAAPTAQAAQGQAAQWNNANTALDSAAQANRTGQVGTQGVNQTDLSGYMNPFNSAVTQNTVNEALRANQISQGQLDSKATMAGAFGGDRAAIEQQENQRNMQQTLQNTLGQLNSQNFGNAQQQAQTDLSRSLQSQGMNQSTGLQTNLTNAQLQQQSGLSNQSALNSFNMANLQNQQQTGMQNTQNLQQANLSNQQMQGQYGLAGFQAGNQNAQFNAGLSQQAQQLNQAAGLQGASLNLNAANSGANVGNLQQQMFDTGTQALAASGAQQQGQNQQSLNLAYNDFTNQQNYPWTQLGRIANLMYPAMNTGSTTNTTTSSPSNSGASGLGAAASIAGAIPWESVIAAFGSGGMADIGTDGGLAGGVGIEALDTNRFPQETIDPVSRGNFLQAPQPPAQSGSSSGGLGDIAGIASAIPDIISALKRGGLAGGGISALTHPRFTELKINPVSVHQTQGASIPNRNQSSQSSMPFEQLQKVADQLGSNSADNSGGDMVSSEGSYNQDAGSGDFMTAASGGHLSKTTPEPSSDLHAQIRAVMDPNHPKQAALLNHGVLFTNNPHIASAAADGLDDDRMAGILGYPSTKGQAMASSNPRALQARDSSGNVVHEAVVPEASGGIAAMSRHVPAGGSLADISPAEAQQRRFMARGGETRHQSVDPYAVMNYSNLQPASTRLMSNQLQANLDPNLPVSVMAAGGDADDDYDDSQYPPDGPPHSIVDRNTVQMRDAQPAVDQGYSSKTLASRLFSSDKTDPNASRSPDTVETDTGYKDKTPLHRMIAAFNDSDAFAPRADNRSLSGLDIARRVMGSDSASAAALHQVNKPQSVDPSIPTTKGYDAYINQDIPGQEGGLSAGVPGNIGPTGLVGSAQAQNVQQVKANDATPRLADSQPFPPPPPNDPITQPLAPNSAPVRSPSKPLPTKTKTPGGLKGNTPAQTPQPDNPGNDNYWTAGAGMTTDQYKSRYYDPKSGDYIGPRQPGQYMGDQQQGQEQQTHGQGGLGGFFKNWLSNPMTQLGFNLMANHGNSNFGVALGQAMQQTQSGIQKQDLAHAQLAMQQHHLETQDTHNQLLDRHYMQMDQTRDTNSQITADYHNATIAVRQAQADAAAARTQAQSDAAAARLQVAQANSQNALEKLEWMRTHGATTDNTSKIESAERLAQEHENHIREGIKNDPSMFGKSPAEIDAVVGPQVDAYRNNVYSRYGLQPSAAPAAPAAQPQGVPNRGDVVKGYRFKGGDPRSQNSWEKV